MWGSGNIGAGLEEDHPLSQALAVFAEAGRVTRQRRQGLTWATVCGASTGAIRRIATHTSGRQRHPPAGAAGGCQGARSRAGGAKVLVKFLLCCRCCQALVRIFLPCILWALCHLAPSGRAASLGVGTSRLQRPSPRAGVNTLHPSLDASCDDRWQACGRRSHLLDDACFTGPACPRAASTNTWAQA